MYIKDSFKKVTKKDWGKYNMVMVIFMKESSKRI